MGPSVLTATGTKMCVLVMDAYFKDLRSAAASAATPTLVAVTETLLLLLLLLLVYFLINTIKIGQKSIAYEKRRRVNV